MTKVTIDETTYSVTVAEENVNVTVADATETLHIQIASGASLHQVISSGDGNSLVVGSTGGLTTLKSLSAGDNVTFSDDGNTITISSEDDLSNNTTDDLAEGTTNLYYTDARVDAWLQSGGVTEINFENATTLSWNDDDGTLEFPVNDEVTLQIGQESLIHVKNQSGSALSNGDVVYVTGASGSKIEVSLADSSSEATSSKAIAVMTQDLNINGVGYASTSGLVRGLDTSSITEGSAIYLSTNGSYTDIQPSTPHHLVPVGWVVRSHASEGAIFVHIVNGFELEELHNVLITSEADGDLIRWNSTGSYWENATLESQLADVSGHIIPSADNTYDLGSTNSKWRSLYLSGGSLYIEGQKVIGSVDGTIDFTTDDGENINMYAGGNGTSGDLIFNSASGITRLEGTDIRLNPVGSGTTTVRGTLEAPDIHVGDLELDASGIQQTAVGQNLTLKTSGTGFVYVETADFYVGDVNTSAVKIDENSISRFGGGIVTIDGFTNSADMTTAINTAETNANTYTDTRETAITTAYQAYADQSEADAITTSNSYADTAIANLVDSAPATLDTLNELAAALGDDPNFATTVTNSIATKWTQDNTKISNWDTAYSWGDHSLAGYLTDYTVTQADVTQHQAALTITESQISDLDHYTNADFDTQLATKSTSDLTEGSNLYYTDGRVLNWFATTGLGMLSTDVILEGSNKYFTDARAITAIESATDLDLNSTVTIEGSVASKSTVIGDSTVGGVYDTHGFTVNGGDTAWAGINLVEHSGSNKPIPNFTNPAFSTTIFGGTVASPAAVSNGQRVWSSFALTSPDGNTPQFANFRMLGTATENQSLTNRGVKFSVETTANGSSATIETLVLQGDTLTVNSGGDGKITTGGNLILDDDVTVTGDLEVQGKAVTNLNPFLLGGM